MKRDCSKSFCDHCKKEVTEVWNARILLDTGVHFTFSSSHTRYLDLCKVCFENLAPKELLEEFIL